MLVNFKLITNLINVTKINVMQSFDYSRQHIWGKKITIKL